MGRTYYSIEITVSKNGEILARFTSKRYLNRNSAFRWLDEINCEAMIFGTELSYQLITEYPDGTLDQEDI